jgi:hydroxymethylpyrimidine/phosphomethylpyrimidine kinase
MCSESNSLPVVLAIGGHDPSGGAGIQADIEALAANGAHAVTLITCLTLQDSCNIHELHPVKPELLHRQAELLLADTTPSAIKIGLLGNADIASVVAGLLRNQPNIPVILDPILAAGGGADLAASDLLRTLREELLPRCDLITPNIPEAIRLSGLETEAALQACARHLLKLGPRAVLITGTHDPQAADEINHHLFSAEDKIKTTRNPRLPGEYHGSGCTLAAAITAYLARGLSLEQAVNRGLDFTWQSLRHAFHSGRCQATPDRLFHLFRLSGNRGD